MTPKPLSPRLQPAALRLLAYFARGLVVVTPLALTAYVLWWVLRTIDGWLGIPIPGLGLVITGALIMLVGFLASTVITRSLVRYVEDLFSRLPFVRLLYNSTRDLLNAFVGTHRRFDRPVLVSITDHAQVFGFVTQDVLDGLAGADGSVAVYAPQSYNFAGQLLIVPASRVQIISAKSADVLAFIVSGGITGANFGPAAVAPAAVPAAAPTVTPARAPARKASSQDASP